MVLIPIQSGDDERGGSSVISRCGDGVVDPLSNRVSGVVFPYVDSVITPFPQSVRPSDHLRVETFWLLWLGGGFLHGIVMKRMGCDDDHHRVVVMRYEKPNQISKIQFCM